MEWYFYLQFDEIVLRSLIRIRKILFDDRCPLRPDHAFEKKMQNLFHRKKLHGYTVHQKYPTLYFPTDAHNVKKRRIIKTF